MVHRLHSAGRGVALMLFHSLTTIFTFHATYQKCKSKKHITVRREVKRLSLVMDKKNQMLLPIKGEAEKTQWFPPTTQYTRKPVPHTARPYVLLLAAAQTQAAEPRPCLSP